MLTNISPAPKRIERVVPCEKELSTLPLSFYKCQYCDLHVKTKSNLRAHLIKTHKLVEDEKDIAFLTKKKIDTSYVYHCPIASCKYTIDKSKGFSKFSRLKQHYQIVHMQKAYQCTSCKQLFSTPTAQAYHSKTCGHIFECSVCQRQYSQKKFLHQHVRRLGHKVSVDSANVSPRSNPKAALPVSNRSEVIQSNLPSVTSEQRSTSIPVTKAVIMPVFILQYGKLNDDMSMAMINDNIRSLLTNSQILSSLANTESPSSTISVLPHSNTEVSMQKNTDFMEVVPLSIDNDSGYSTQMAASFQQTSPSLCTNLVDVGTATMCLADSHTQTDCFAVTASASQCHQNQPHQLCAPVTNQQQPLQDLMLQNRNNLKPDTGAADECDRISDILYNMTDSCIGTTPVVHCSAGNSPPDFYPTVSNVGAYAPPVTSIGLQYMPMNSHGTMTANSPFLERQQHQQQPMPNGFIQQQQSELQQLPEFRSMISAGNHTGFATSNQTQMMNSVASSVCLSPASQFDQCSSSPPAITGISYPNWSTRIPRPTQSNVCLSARPTDFLGPPPPPQLLLQQQPVNTFVNVPVSSYNYQTETDCYGYGNPSSWAQVNLGPEPCSFNQFAPNCTKSIQISNCPPSANSVAVETTIDSNDFDLPNPNWFLTDSSNMQTQTMGGSTNEFGTLWSPNNMETQTVFQQQPQQHFFHQQQQTYWPRTYTGVCVGVNTDLTPEKCGSFP